MIVSIKITIGLNIKLVRGRLAKVFSKAFGASACRVNKYMFLTFSILKLELLAKNFVTQLYTSLFPNYQI